MSEYKQAIVIRTDTEMRKGKMCGQVAHASVSAAFQSYWYGGSKKNITIAWFDDNQTKVVLKVGSEAELKEISKKAQEAGLMVYEIRDAGHTQIDPHTFTCIGIGPDENGKIDAITGDLKLL